jgi:rare lipoprotein A
MRRLTERTKRWCLIGLLGAALATVLILAVPASSKEELPTEHGLASFYGPGFHGEETASGEIFNQHEMVAAHRRLPLGSVVRVTNLENDRQVVLRVIDRGPYGRNYRRGTIIDVSKGAAERLDFIEDGLVRVRVEVLETPAVEEEHGEDQAEGG